MDKKKAAKIITWIIVPLMASFFILDIITVAVGNKYAARYEITQEDFDGNNGNDKIHFLNTGNSDCILLESNGHFALIDSGEGNYNPRRKTEYHGYEQQVLTYLKKVARSDDGLVHLDFILGTHYHYDHVGNFVPIINDEEIVISKAYFKEYNPVINHKYEDEKWMLKSFYDDMLSALKDKNITLIQQIPETIKFNDFALSLYNTGYYSDLEDKGANAGSIGIKVTKGKKSAFLAADITGPSGLEQKLKGTIGYCDLLKVGHHGYYGSSSMAFLKEISPELCIVTNQQGKVYPNVKWNLTMFAKVAFYGTYDYNGIIALFTDDNRIILTNNIH